MCNDQAIIKVLILILLSSLVGGEHPSNNKKLQSARVIEVIDGDTVDLKFPTGTRERVRLMGIDTPELDQFYGKKAANYTKSQLLDKKVYLERDVKNKDKYDRLLRYIWLAPVQQTTEEEIRGYMFNAELLLEGYAKAAVDYTNLKYAKPLERFAEEARQKNKGLWGQSEEIKLIDFTKTVNCGHYAKVTIQATPGVEYNITVYYGSGVSKAAGLKTKQADAMGVVSWQWKVGCSTKEGTYPIIITGRDQKHEVEFTVVNK